MCKTKQQEEKKNIFIHKKDFRRHLQSSLNRIMTSRTDISNNRSTTNKRATRARGPKRWDLNIYDLHQPISGKQCPQTLTLDFA